MVNAAQHGMESPRRARGPDTRTSTCSATDQARSCPRSTKGTRVDAGRSRAQPDAPRSVHELNCTTTSCLAELL